MKKRNLLIHSVIATALMSLLGSVQAATVSSTPIAFAREMLLGSTPNATSLTILASAPIKVLANASIAAGSTVYVYVKFTGGSIASLPNVIGASSHITINQGDGTGSNTANTSLTLTSASLGSSTGTANPSTVGAGVDYLVFQVSTGTDTIGVGGIIATIGGTTALAFNNATGMLSAPLTATASVGVSTPSTRFGALPAIASNFDPSSATTVVATAVQGITLAAAASTNAGKVDLNSVPVATLFDSNAIGTNTINLGSVTATNGSAVQADGTTAYNIAGQTASVGLSAVVTVPAGFLAPLGTTGQLWLQATPCGAASSVGAANSGLLTGSASTVFTTAALAAAATSVTLSATGTPTSAAVYNICMGTSKTIAAVAGTPTLAVTFQHAGTSTDSNEIATTSLYPLTLNGQQRDIRSYIPASTVGYTSFVRLINTGAVAAAISGQWIYENGTAGTTGVLLASHPAGGAVTLSSAQIEASLGAPTVIGGNRPRLRLTAPTNALEAQSFFMTNANGNFSEVTGAQ